MFYFRRYLQVSVVRDKVLLEVFFLQIRTCLLFWFHLYDALLHVFFFSFSPYFNTMPMLFGFQIFRDMAFLDFQLGFLFFLLVVWNSSCYFFLLLIHIYKIQFPYINISCTTSSQSTHDTL